MRNIKWCVGLLIGVFLITMSGCSMLQKEQEGVSYSFSEEGDFMVLELEEVVLKIDNGSLSEEAMNKTASLVEKASEAADRFLGEYKKEEEIICYVHGGDGSTHWFGNEIHVFYPENQNIPYVMLMSMVKAGNPQAPDWIQIGLGSYAASLYGETLIDTWARTIDVYKELPRIDEQQLVIEYDLKQLAGMLLDKEAYQQVWQLGDLTQMIAAMTDAEEAYGFRGAYSVCAGSFVQYLVTEYGMDAVMEIYNGKTPEDVCGKSKEILVNLWKQGLETR